MNLINVRYFLTFALIFFHLSLFAQDSPVQVIRGTLTDALTGRTLAGASVLLPDTAPVKGTTSDEYGRYRLENVPVGRYRLEATYLGYELLQIPEVLVESGKEVIIDLALSEETANLAEVVVKSKNNYGSALSPVSVQRISIEEVLRFPATFNDPARLAMTYPGVVNTNDQANHISVRGNSPNSTSWRLEGVEIVNPNHLGDAGTASSRPSISGGGVNILSAQLLGTSNFYSSVFPLEYGNALGGIMDMRFRNGNDEKHEFTAQAGLVGFDFSAEGPLSKEKKISYLVNYRYSFVGLLTAMGVDFGGEAISFQDLAFNVKIPIDKNSTLKIFGMGGISENIFTGLDNPDDWEVDKDRYNIAFTNRMGALGVSYFSVLNNRASIKTSLVTSNVRTNKRNDIRLNQSTIRGSFTYDSLSYQKNALQSQFIYKLNKKQSLNIGISAVDHIFKVNTRHLQAYTTGEERGWLIGAYARWNWKPINPINITVGLHNAYFSLSNSNSIEPRGSVSWQASLKDNFSLAYGLHSQLQPAQTYLAPRDSDNFGSYLGFSKSHHFVLEYRRQINIQSTFSAALYYQSLFDIPITADTLSLFQMNFSTINTLGDFKSFTLVNEGTGRNYGLELNWRRFIQDNYFVLLNTSLYRSKFTAYDGIERNSRFDGRFLFNLTGGKEFSWQKKNRKKIMGINARITYAGGLRRIANSALINTEGYGPFESNSFDFSEKQNAYFKVDFRIYLKNNKSKYNTTLAMDLQNLTSRKNDGYYYYDSTQDKVLAQKQLGLIPNLSYRIEF